MKYLSKSLCIVMTAVMCTSVMLTGCKASSKAPVKVSDTSKAVNLKMILLGTKPVDCDEVYAKVNKRLKKLANATITPIFYDWGDWQTKYNLAFASGEDFDLIYTSYWAYYNEQASKNGFLELTKDMLKKDAPKTWSDVTSDQWTQTKVNGKIFMVPYTNKEVGNIIAMIRGDLRKKYNLPKVKNKTDLINYMDAIAKNEKSIQAYHAGGSDGTLMLRNLLFAEDNNQGIMIGGQQAPYAYDKTNLTKVVTTNLLDDPKYLDELKQLQEFKNKGYWSQDALSDKNPNETSFDNGTSAVYARGPLNISQAYIKDNLLHPEWKLEVVDVNPNVDIQVGTALNNGMAIHRTSKNPDRALKVLDLLRYDKELNDLTTLGIQGTHWKAVGDTQYKSLPGSKNFAPDSACPWGWRTSLFRTDAGTPQAVLDINKRANDSNPKINPLQLFNFDPTNVKSEVAAVSSVLASYNPILSEGFSSNIPKTVAEFKAKLDAAGYQKVITEWKKQAEAFMKTYNSNK